MKFHALAVDYDGTIADNGLVSPETVDALARLRNSGRKLILVTGRLLKPLLDAFPEVGLFDLVVAENGALLYNPETRAERLLIDAPTPEFVEKLRERGVAVSEVGKVIIATHVPYETLVLDVIRDMTLELQIIFNKGAVMILPGGVNKAFGLKAALKELGLSRHNTIACGDAENDVALLQYAEVAVAVENAVEALKKLADVNTRGKAGAGVTEVIERILADDLKEMHHRPGRGFSLGTDAANAPLWTPVYGTRMLITGDSGGGKSMLAVNILTQMVKTGYQACVMDPEGDFQLVEEAIVLGTREKLPTPEEVVQVIRQGKSCVVSLFSAKRSAQPEAFSHFHRALQAYRLQTGRPHFYIIDEAHYPISPSWPPIHELHLEDWRSVMYVTAFTEKMPTSVLKSINLFVAMAQDPAKYLAEFGKAIEMAPPAIPPRPGDDWAFAWRPHPREAFWFHLPYAAGEHKRHRHQYYDGDMEPPDQFRFRGPEGKLNLAAGNLKLFVKLAEGIDDDTWLHHLRRGDYAEWFREKIQDSDLAALAERLKNEQDLPAAESRERIAELIRKLYVKHQI